MLLIMCQVLLIVFIFKEAVNEEEMIAAYKEYPKNMEIVLARFLCAIFLHISMADELKQAFTMMKYALNHMWKFRSWKAAFFIGST